MYFLKLWIEYNKFKKIVKWLDEAIKLAIYILSLFMWPNSYYLFITYLN